MRTLLWKDRAINPFWLLISTAVQSACVYMVCSLVNLLERMIKLFPEQYAKRVCFCHVAWHAVWGVSLGRPGRKFSDMISSARVPVRCSLY